MIEENEDQEKTRSEYRMQILSPEMPCELEDLTAELKPKPRYVGPGVWYKTISLLKYPNRKNGGF